MSHQIGNTNKEMAKKIFFKPDKNSGVENCNNWHENFIFGAFYGLNCVPYKIRYFEVLLPYVTIVGNRAFGR